MPLIPLSSRNGFAAFVVVSINDIGWLHQWKWSLQRSQTLYAIRKVGPRDKRTTVYMHREILARKLGRPLSPTEEVDHRDKQGLNNKRSNLRLSNRGQNNTNRKTNRKGAIPYRGVYRCREHFKASIINRHIGVYATMEDAARAYDREALRLFGSFAQLNFRGR